MRVIWWIRRDLRLHANPVLHWAAQHEAQLIPLYIHAPDEEAPWQPGAASRWWLHESLQHLRQQLADQGHHLIIRRGPTQDALDDVIRSTGAEAVAWNRLYEPAVVARDTTIKKQLQTSGLQAQSFGSYLLYEPWQIQNKAGLPFRVFTPFWKHCLSRQPQLGNSGPASARRFAGSINTLSIEDLDLVTGIPWHDKLHAHWQPGEQAAQQRLAAFCSERLMRYATDRDRPDCDGSSKLSPHLHFGEICPAQAWLMALEHGEYKDKFLAELGWREFAHHLLWHYPRTTSENFNPRFDRFGWHQVSADDSHWRAWTKGETGIELVDAGMQQLWQSGWMHNRVRMLVGSVLTKNLGIHWRHGAAWFWDTLVDANLANNSMGWQWVAGCGADAAPYFRIFNPDTQAQKFDPAAIYRQTWLRNRPRPRQAIVDLAESRRVALARYQDIRQE